MQLTRLAEDHEKIKQAGADILAISVDNPSYAWSMAQTTGAKYQILSDIDKKVIISYGVLNPKEHGGIANPAVFIVDKAGIIRFQHVGKDAADRPPDELIMEELKKLSAAK